MVENHEIKKEKYGQFISIMIFVLLLSLWRSIYARVASIRRNVKVVIEQCISLDERKGQKETKLNSRNE